MPRALTDAARTAIGNERSTTHNLVYMDLADARLYLAVDAVQDIEFQRTTGPVTDTEVRVWEGVGGAIAPGTAEETTDFDSQGQDVQFVAIDPAFTLGTTLLNTSAFNRDFQWWRLHFHEAGANAGQVRAAVLLMHGKLNGAFEVTDVSPQDFHRAEPGTIRVRFRVMSPLSVLEVRRSIQTNLRSHQKWYPGDLGMEHVARMQNHKIYFGFNSPN